MVKYNVADIGLAFKSLGIKKGDVLNIHNSLFSFGFPKDLPIKNLPEGIFNEIQKIIGSNGTIAVPTFNFDFCKGVDYNRQTTPPQIMGNFSDYVFSLPDSKRSFHPLQSISVVGKFQNEIVANDTSTAFGEGSAWDTLLNLDTKVILLGSNFNSASIFHMVEERELVPYRYWKNFSGKYIDNDVESYKTYAMYVRELDPSPILKMASIENLLAAINAISIIPFGAGRIISFKAKDLIKVVQEKIKANPYYFVGYHRDFLKESI